MIAKKTTDSVKWAASTVTGAEGSAIALAPITGTWSKLSIGGIPVGATLSDGNGHSFTAAGTLTSVDVTGWSLNSLTLTTISDTNFKLVAKTGSGVSATESVVVNPLAPTVDWAASASGAVSQPVALGALSVTVNSLAGDGTHNTLKSLVVSGIPTGVVLSDGHGHSFTASATKHAVDVTAWTHNSLTAKSASAADFTLTVTATERDAEGNTSVATASEHVSIALPTLTLSAGAPSAALVEAATDAAGQTSPGVDGSVAQLTIGGNVSGATFDTTGWTANANGTFSKAGVYGVAELNVGTGALSYHLDNTLAATNALADGQAATDAFTVQVKQGTLTASTPVSFAITGSNDAAVLSSAAINLAETDTVLTTGGALTVQDVDSAAQFIAQTATPGANGSFSIDAAGNWTYTTDAAHDEFAAGQTYTETFTVKSIDGTATTVSVQIAGTNDGPVAQALTGVVDASGAAPALLAASFTDPDQGDTHTYTVDTTGTIGLVTDNGDGTFSYDPNGQFATLQVGQTATDSFAYTVTDAAGASSTQTATVTVMGTAQPQGPSPFTVIDPAQAATQASAIASAVLGNTPGITIDPASLQMVAGPSSAGFYDGSLGALGIGKGLLITSGTMPGTSNTVGYFGQDNNMAGDPALDAVVNTVFNTVSYDATTIKFSFTVTDPTLTGISFDAVFGTDEYPEWVDQFVDIGVVLVNGINVAYFGNNPMAPLSVIGSNLAANYFVDNTGNLDTPSFGGVAVPGVPSTLPIEYDGISHLLKISAPVHTGVNTIEIGIADTGDHVYDSGLFISNLAATSVPTSGVNLDVPCTDSSDTVTGTIANEVIDAKGGNDIVAAGGGDDIVLGGAGDDQLSGDDGNDFLDGGVGQNVVSGGAGDDVIQHISGIDQIDGGTGFNTLKLDLSAGTAGESIDLSDAAVTQLLSDGSSFVNIEAIQFHGGAGNDSVVGGAAADQLNGGAGDDVLAGAGGDDQIVGGAGIDTAAYAGAQADYDVVDLGNGQYQVTDLHAGSPEGTDMLSSVELLQFSDGTVDLVGLASGATIQGTAGDDIINANSTVAGQPLPTAQGDLIFGGAGDDIIRAGDGGDRIEGGADNDQLYGEAGDDILVGGTGHDELFGGSGADTFVFTSVADLVAAGGHDQIDDFNHAQGDIIDLGQIDAVAGGADDAFTLVASFSGAAGELITINAGDGYVVEGDTNGDAVADFSLTVKSATLLVASDFAL